MERKMMDLIQTIYQAVLEGDANAAKEGVQAALRDGITPIKIMNEGLIAAMGEVGKMFETGEYYVPEMLISARAMQASLGLVKPFLEETGVKAVGKIAIGTVKGDLHDIGKNLVGMMLEGAGFEVIDLGTDVAPEKFIQAVQLYHPQIIGLSALLTTTMPSMGATIGALKAAGLRDQVKVLVGGAPVTEAFAQQIGADGYSPDASVAARQARALVS
jgi:5-methyltetrahydrofolate--homocysteine methyltransferase